MRKIEVKGDRHTTGNFFFETISNKSKNTPGCFLYTEADYLFYFFVKTHELYILPMPETRHWFLSNIRRFKTSGTTSLVNNDYYQSEGKLVPIDTVMKEVEGAKVVVI